MKSTNFDNVNINVNIQQSLTKNVKKEAKSFNNLTFFNNFFVVNNKNEVTNYKPKNFENSSNMSKSECENFIHDSPGNFDEEIKLKYIKSNLER